MPQNTNASPPPPTGVLWLVLILLALLGTLLRQLGKPGAWLERWAMKRLGVWEEGAE